MLLALRPDFVAEHWDEIGGHIKTAVPEADMNHILNLILVGGMTCWTLGGKDKKAQGFMLTTVSVDRYHREPTLVVYALAGNKFTSEAIADAFSVLKIIAKAKKCTRISALTKNEKVLNMVRRDGWDTETRYVYKEV